MTTFRWFNGNLGFYGSSYLMNYTLASQTATQFTYRAGDFTDAAYDPFRIVFTIAGGVLWTDPDTGGRDYTAGTITSITYYNASGAKIAEMTGLNADAAFAMALLNPDNMTVHTKNNFWDYVQELNPQGALIVGSDVSGRAGLTGYDFRPFEIGDDLITTTGNDTVRAGGENDYIGDQGGADSYDGGAGGLDVVGYGSWRNKMQVPQTGIVADLAAGTVTGPDGKVDRLTGIEGVQGTHNADVLRGSAGNNVFMGGAGKDTFDGRAGFDEVFYGWDGGNLGIRVDMASGMVRDCFGVLDKLISIESVVGSYKNDRFVDTAGAQRFDGYYGDDFFSLSTGDDKVTGGFGADTFKFIGTNFGKDRITDFNPMDGDRIHLTGVSGFNALTFSNANGNRIINVGASQVILEGDAGMILSPSDFIFG